MPPVSVTMQARNLPEPLTLPAAGWADPPPAVVPEDAAVVAEDPPALGAALVEDVPAPEVPDWPEVLGLELPHAAAAMASTATPAATLIAPTRGRHLRAWRAWSGLTSDWVNIAPPSLAPSLGSGPLLEPRQALESVHALPTTDGFDGGTISPPTAEDGARRGPRRSGGPPATFLPMVDRADWPALREAAVAVAARAYAPYSGLHVGAAALTDAGTVVTGCNVENSSLGLTLCAECGVVSALRAGGASSLVAVSVVAGDGRPLAPCGRCRQVLLDHGGPGILVDAGEGAEPATLGSLLPGAFDDAELTRRRG